MTVDLNIRPAVPASELMADLDLAPADEQELLRLAEAGVLRSADPLLINALARRFGVSAGALRRVHRQIGGAAERARWEQAQRQMAPKSRFRREGRTEHHAVDEPIGPSEEPTGGSHPADELLR